MKGRDFVRWCLFLTVTLSFPEVHSWGHDVGEPELEKLPIWTKCYGGGDCVFQPVQVQEKKTNGQVTVQIDGIQTSVDQEKFSPVPTDRTWVCYINPRGEITNENIRCILYPQERGNT